MIEPIQIMSRPIDDGANVYLAVAVLDFGEFTLPESSG